MCDRQTLRRVREALNRTQQYFLRTQHAHGHWCGELESNPTIEAEYIMLARFMGSDEDDRIPRVAEDVRRRQQDDGSWCIYYGSPGDLSTTIECYFALKLAGDRQGAAHMARARAFILEHGGLAKARVFTKIWLALFGQWDWNATPSMLPEMVLLPGWAPFNIYRFASWARATIVPMTVILTLRPTRPPAPEECLDELRIEGAEAPALTRFKPRALSAQHTFLMMDRALRAWRDLQRPPGRERALRAAADWIVAHQEADGSWGGIQPPWAYSLIALSAMGRPLDDPVVARGLDGFRRHWSLPSEDGAALRVQACLSPAWDTALAMRGLLDSGMEPGHPAIGRAADWLLSKEVRARGDWAVRGPRVEPSGWAFGFDNIHYPDVDDSAVIVTNLAMVAAGDPSTNGAADATIRRAVRWLTAMQSSNGGWAAFDHNNSSRSLAKIPFADFGEVLDPPSADITAHVLEMYAALGHGVEHPAVRAGLDYLWQQQEPDGAWFGRWGVNYLYGTGAVLPALEALGIDMARPEVRRAVQWLIDHQNPDGGWGETCMSYADPALRGRGDSTASQTSWALIALIAAGEAAHESAGRGVEFLLRRQKPDGTWDEPQFTGCGFPGYGHGDSPNNHRAAHAPDAGTVEMSAAFMINYHLYRNYFPLWALGRYHKTLAPDGIGRSFSGGSSVVGGG